MITHFLSFDDFDKAAYKNVSGREELLQHLSLYKRKFRSNLRKEQCLFFGRIKNGLKLSLI